MAPGIQIFLCGAWYLRLAGVHCQHQIYPILGGKVVGDITSADIKALPNH